MQEAQHNLQKLRNQTDQIYKDAQSLLEEAKLKLQDTQKQLSEINDRMQAEAEKAVADNLDHLKAQFDRVAVEFRSQSEELLREQRASINKSVPSNR